MWWKLLIWCGNGRCRGDSIEFELDVELCCDGNGVGAGGGNAIAPAFDIMDVETPGDIGMPDWCVDEWPNDDGIVGGGGAWFGWCWCCLPKLFTRFLWPPSKFPPLIRWWKWWKSLLDGKNDARSAADGLGSLRASVCHSPVAVTVVQCHGLV